MSKKTLTKEEKQRAVDTFTPWLHESGFTLTQVAELQAQIAAYAALRFAGAEEQVKENE